MNDIIATIMFILGVGLLVFSFVWYEKTIKIKPKKENYPAIIYREIK